MTEAVFSLPVTDDRWAKSRLMLKRARRSLAGGVSSPFRAKSPVPLYLKDAQGSRIEDVDGNEYIDYTLAWGPMILGHRHPLLVEAIARQANRPHNYGAQHELEYQVAELIQATVPCAERVAFTSSGSEAVQGALRLARACTGRELVVKFEGHYHGWMDSVLWSYKPSLEQLSHTAPRHGVAGSAGQVASAGENIAILPWNDAGVVERFFAERGHEVAAIVSEPVVCNSGCLLPGDGYLAALASIAHAHGALLIFDEVITGFRRAPGGAQSWYGVTPDLATLGKAIGGGLPLSAIVGRGEILDAIFTRGVVFGGTFNGNPISLAAAMATITELSRDGGAALIHANRIGKLIMEGLRASAARRGVPLTVSGFGAAFALHFTEQKRLMNYRDTLADDSVRLRSFLMGALREGVALLPDGRMYVSAVHSEDDAQSTITALDRVLQRLLQ